MKIDAENRPGVVLWYCGERFFFPGEPKTAMAQAAAMLRARGVRPGDLAAWVADTAFFDHAEPPRVARTHLTYALSRAWDESAQVGNVGLRLGG